MCFKSYMQLISVLIEIGSLKNKKKVIIQRFSLGFHLELS